MKLIKTENDTHTVFKNENGQYHREDGPAIIYKINSSQSQREEWWFNGHHHRGDGLPAIYFTNDKNPFKEWQIHGKAHRVKGPAFIREDYICYYKNNQCHRLNAPAIIYENKILKSDYYEFNIRIL